jgi:hypothetical protein
VFPGVPLCAHLYGGFTTKTSERLSSGFLARLKVRAMLPRRLLGHPCPGKARGTGPFRISRFSAVVVRPARPLAHLPVDDIVPHEIPRADCNLASMRSAVILLVQTWDEIGRASANPAPQWPQPLVSGRSALGGVFVASARWNRCKPGQIRIPSRLPRVISENSGGCPPGEMHSFHPLFRKGVSADAIVIGPVPRRLPCVRTELSPHGASSSA